MIARAPEKTKRIGRIRLWHRFYVLLPRRIHIHGEIGSYRVWGEVLMRRWSQTYQRFYWARVGTVEEGTRKWPR